MDKGWLISTKKLSYHRDYYHTPSDTAKKMYFYVQEAGHFNCEKDFHLWRKEYKSILVKYTLDGKGFLKYRDKNYELDKNQLFILDCYDYQEYYSYKETVWDNKWVHFYGSASLEFFNYIFENNGPVFNMPEDNHIVEHINDIILMMEQGDPQFEIKASSIVHQILTEILLVTSTDTNSAENPEYHSYIKSARKFIELNYQEHIDVDDVADAAKLSRYHFSRVFKRFTGFSPYEYLVKYRINKAKSLLNNTDMSIECIATDTGFLDAGTFIRAFKKYEELTPLKYRSNFSHKGKA